MVLYKYGKGTHYNERVIRVVQRIVEINKRLVFGSTDEERFKSTAVAHAEYQAYGNVLMMLQYDHYLKGLEELYFGEDEDSDKT